MNIQENEKKSAFVAIIGKPNVGKSSLLNTLVGEKIAIVSQKPQTTRNRIMGVLTHNDTQLVFIDTPGFHKARNKLGNYMVNSVKGAVSDVDFAIFVIDALESKPKKTELELLDTLRQRKIPAVAVINKIDLLKDKEFLFPIIKEISEMYNFSAVVPISVKTGSGVNLLLSELTALALPGEFFFPEDTLTDQPEKMLAAETIREKFLRFTGEEIPHGLFIYVEKMKRRNDKPIIDIDAIIYCEKKSHKAIVIGKGGSMLKKIGQTARLEMEEFFECKINLKLWVKIREDWRNKESILKNFGYDEKLLKQ